MLSHTSFNAWGNIYNFVLRFYFYIVSYFNGQAFWAMMYWIGYTPVNFYQWCTLFSFGWLFYFAVYFLQTNFCLFFVMCLFSWWLLLLGCLGVLEHHVNWSNLLLEVEIIRHKHKGEEMGNSAISSSTPTKKEKAPSPPTTPAPSEFDASSDIG